MKLSSGDRANDEFYGWTGSGLGSAEIDDTQQERSDEYE
jgi:hypothetical protein